MSQAWQGRARGTSSSSKHNAHHPTPPLNPHSQAARLLVAQAAHCRQVAPVISEAGDWDIAVLATRRQRLVRCCAASEGGP